MPRALTPLPGHQGEHGHSCPSDPACPQGVCKDGRMLPHGRRLNWASLTAGKLGREQEAALKMPKDGALTERCCWASDRSEGLGVLRGVCGGRGRRRGDGLAEAWVPGEEVFLETAGLWRLNALWGPWGGVC